MGKQSLKTTFLLGILFTVCSAIQLEVLQGPVYRVHDDTDYPLTVRFTHNASDPVDMVHINHILSDGLEATVKVKMEEEWQLEFTNDTMHFSAEDIANGTNKTVIFYGFWWGYMSVDMLGTGSAIIPILGKDRGEEFLTYGEDLEMEDWVVLNNDTMIIVDRKPSSKIVDTVYVATATSFMLLNTVNMGCQLDLMIIWNVLKKPIGPACGVVSQFICMPIFSFLMGYLLLEDPLHRLGLFTLGCSPGGNVSNFWTLLFHGDINLSITMTFCSTIIAMGMMPFWMATLGQRLVQDTTIEVPFLNLILSLVMLSIPVAIGLVIKHKKPEWAKISAKIVKPMTFCMIAYFIVAGVYNNYKAIGLMTWNIVVAGLCVSFGGYIAGASLSAIMCLKTPQIIAISIETAFQNAAIAFILLKISLGTPDSDLATVPVLAQMIQTGPPLMVLYVIWQIVQRSCGMCIPEDKLQQANVVTDDVEKELMESPVSTPHTPGLLYDPSNPDAKSEHPLKYAVKTTSISTLTFVK